LGDWLVDYLLFIDFNLELTDQLKHTQYYLSVLKRNATCRQMFSLSDWTAPGQLAGSWMVRHEIAAAHSTTLLLSAHTLQLVHP
jgi:hypothetical protein